MSATAIAQVTSVLKELLRANMASNVSVTLLQPTATLTNNSVNLYLYRVIENPQLKNIDWRGDRNHPPANTPGLALELFYLLTPYADPPDPGATSLHQTHTLLGRAMQIFNDHPVINDVHTSSFDFDTLSGINDLRNAYDKIIVRLHPLSTEEMSKIWSMFNDAYRLSIIYQVSLVHISPRTPPSTRAAPVLVTGLDVIQSIPPRLIKLEPSSGGTGNTITLRGFGMVRKNLSTHIRFGGRILEPVAASEKKVEIVVPSDLEAGPDQEVRLALNGQVSVSLIYTISPWLRRIRPLRGAPGPAPTPPIPITLEVDGVDLQSAAAISVTIGGAVQPHTVLDRSNAQFTLPLGLANGFHPICIQVDGQMSNVRNFEIVPLLQDLTPSPPVVGNPLQIDGQRLDGDQVKVDFGSSSVIIGQNSSASQVQVPRVPQMDSGTYEIRVTVDGHESNPLAFTVP